MHPAVDVIGKQGGRFRAQPVVISFRDSGVGGDLGVRVIRSLEFARFLQGEACIGKHFDGGRWRDEILLRLHLSFQFRGHLRKGHS